MCNFVVVLQYAFNHVTDRVLVFHAFPITARTPVSGLKGSAAKRNVSTSRYVHLKRSAPYHRPRLRFR
jgi:hypothetical protein